MTIDAWPGMRARVPARLRIAAWIVLTAAAGLAALVLTVHSALQADVARRANAQVVQELAEFRQFAATGVDPQTAKPFASITRLFEVYLSRQQPEDAEIIIGWLADSRTWLETRGQRLTSPEFDLVTDGDTALLETILRERRGVGGTRSGQLRWGSLPVVLSGRPVGTVAVAVYIDPMAEEAVQITRLVAVVGLGSLVLIAGISALVAGQILRPVREVRRAAAEITEHDLSRRIPVTGGDDVADVAVQFNAMLDRIQEAFDAEQRFVDDAGHELRTPITVIRGHLELLGDDPQERQATLALVTSELDRMSRMVTDLLSLAKAERPDFLRLQRGVDLAALTLDLDAKVTALGDRRWGLSHIAEGTCTVDPERLTQAVLQLAQNAVEHTTVGDRIVLSSELVSASAPGDPTLVLSVTDEGSGVHPDDVPVLFERFARGQHGPRPRGGAGLGLAIVRSIAEAHGGRAYVETTGGRGARFAVAVPACHYVPRQPAYDEEPS